MGLLENYFLTMVLTIAAAVLIAVSLGTDRWHEYTVDRVTIKAATSDVKIKESPVYFTRYRGLFRTCLADDTDANFLAESPYKEIVTGGVCYLEKGYELTPMESSINLGESYEIRKHIMRLQVACLAFSLACTILTSGLLLYSSLLKRKKYTNAKLMVGFLAIIFAGGAMGSCHGIRYLEDNKIPGADFPTDWGTDPLLRGNYKISFGFSYIIGWVAVGVLVIAEMLMLMVPNSKHDEVRKTKGWVTDAPPIVPVQTMYPGARYEYPTYEGQLVPYIEGMPTRSSQLGLIPNESLYYRN